MKPLLSHYFKILSQVLALSLIFILFSCLEEEVSSYRCSSGECNEVMNSSGYENNYQCSLNCNSSSGSGSASGYWVKHNGGGYISISGNTAKFCQESSGNEFIGTYSSSTGTIEVDFDDRTGNVFKAEVYGDEMTLIQNYSSDHATETQYYSTTNYPCSGSSSNGNGSENSNGVVSFYLTKNIGCSNVKITVSGYGTKTLNSYLTYGFIECEQNGTASWTLPPGRYSYEASCTDLKWGPANFTISENGCLGYELE